MSAESTRSNLAARQRQLVAALLTGASNADFDARQIDIAAASLLRKRMRSVERTWPAVASSLGDRFAESFTEFARTAPLPESGGGLADGRQFCAWLAERGEVSDDVRFQVRRFDAGYRLSAGRLVRRRFARLRLILVSLLS